MSDTDLNQTLRALAEEAELEREDTVPLSARRKTRREKDPSQVYSVRIPVNRLEQLRRAAAARGSAPSALIRELVVAFLDDQPVEPTVTTATEALEVLRQVVLGQARASSDIDPGPTG
jgi:predicted DNA-binding protein